MDATGRALIAAASECRKAGAAIAQWERGGSADFVTETAAVCKRSAEVALESVWVDEPPNDPLTEPETRRGRIAYAAWMLILAGTDEDGRTSDLILASTLLRAAAHA